MPGWVTCRRPSTRPPGTQHSGRRTDTDAVPPQPDPVPGARRRPGRSSSHLRRCGGSTWTAPAPGRDWQLSGNGARMSTSIPVRSNRSAGKPSLYKTRCAPGCLTTCPTHHRCRPRPSGPHVTPHVRSPVLRTHRGHPAPVADQLAAQASAGTARAKRSPNRPDRRGMRADTANAAAPLRPPLGNHAPGLPAHIQPGSQLTQAPHARS